MKNCIVLINKERGISSNKVVNKVKYLLKAKKAGHLGTLDVLGEGLLLVTIGKATKLFDYFLNKDKVYKTIFKFGETSDTLDLEGEITNRDDKVVTIDMIERVIPSFIGKQAQMPPSYSAKKIHGRKAYELAREGKDVKLKTKNIEIYDLKCTRELDKNTFEFLVHCSSGTYIRSLCRDIASSLSTYGIMYAIQRTKCGGFDIKDSYTLEDIEKNKFKVIEIDTIFNYPRLNIKEEDYPKLINGINIKFDKDGLYRAYFNNEYLGNVEVQEGKMKFTFRLC